MSVPVHAPAPPRQRARGAALVLGRLQREYPLVQAVALVGLFVFGSATLSGFGTRTSIYSMLVIAAFLGLASTGQTLAILVGGVDLSIPGWIVAGATTTVQLSGVEKWPFVAILAVLIAGALLVGGLVGLVCHQFRIDPMIVTLGIGAMAAGAVQVWIKGFVSGVPPAWLQRLTSPAGETFGANFPPLAVIWAVLALVLGVVLHRTIVGRWVYATGTNPRAAQLALVPTRRVWIGAFATSALCSVMVGVLLAGFAGAGDANLGDPYLWQSLTAVFIGGTMFGARGDYSRTVLGALLLTVLTTVLIGHDFDYADQQILFGVLILVVVALYGRSRRLRDRI